MTQTSSINLRVQGQQTGTAGDFTTPISTLDYAKALALADGSGENMASVIFADQRTLAASASEDFDLNGSNTDSVGGALGLTKIKAIIIKASDDNTNDVVVGGATSNACYAMFNAATDKIKVKPGGLLVLTAPKSAGYAVTAATADLLKIANSGSGTSVTFDLIIIGA